MIKRLWQWFKNFWQRFFDRKQAVSLQKTEDKVKPPKLSDAEYERFFMQLLDGVNDESWSRGRLGGFLAGSNIKESDLVEWLRGFRERLLEGDGENRELAERMVRLGEVGFGKLSLVAGDIGREFLGGVEEEEEKGEADVWLEKGVEQLKVDDFEEAIASFDKAIENKRHLPQAWYHRGMALYDLERYEEAMNSFGKALAIQPDYELARENRDLAEKKLRKPFFMKWLGR